MKSIKNIEDPKQLYTVDAVRFHVEICKNQWKNINCCDLHLYTLGRALIADYQPKLNDSIFYFERKLSDSIRPPVHIK